MRRVGEAAGIGVDRLAHAQLARLGRHQSGEILFGAAHLLCQCHGDVVGGLYRHNLDRVLYRERLAGREAQLRGTLAGGVGRDHHPVVRTEPPGLERIEHQIEGHDLRDGGRVSDRGRLLGIEDLVGAGVHEHGRKTWQAQRTGGCERRDGQGDRRATQRDGCSSVSEDRLEHHPAPSVTDQTRLNLNDK